MILGGQPPGKVGRRGDLFYKLKGSILTDATFKVCGSSSVGRAPPCQGGCREFESRLPLQKKR